MLRPRELRKNPLNTSRKVTVASLIVTFKQMRPKTKLEFRHNSARGHGFVHAQQLLFSLLNLFIVTSGPSQIIMATKSPRTNKARIESFAFLVLGLMPTHTVAKTINARAKLITPPRDLLKKIEPTITIDAKR